MSTDDQFWDNGDGIANKLCGATAPPPPQKSSWTLSAELQTLKMRENWDKAMDPSCNQLIPEVRGHLCLHRLCLMVTTCWAGRPAGWTVDAGRECGTKSPMVTIHLQVFDGRNLAVWDLLCQICNHVAGF